MPRQQLLSKTIQSLFGGVSQQAPALRLDGQHEDQVNVISTIINGIEKRPPTQHVNVVDPAITSVLTNEKMLVHGIYRDLNEQYLVLATPHTVEPLRIYRVSDGFKMTVNYDTGSDTTYCTHNPFTVQAGLRMATIQDTTIIANKLFTPTMSGTLSPTQDPFAYIWVKNTALRSGATNLGWTFTLGADTSTSASSSARTNDIAELIADGLNLDITDSDAARVSPESSVIKFSLTSGLDFSATLTDTQANKDIIYLKDAVEKITDLPPEGVDGDVFRITGETGSNTDDFFVRFDAATSTWKETIAPGTPTSINADTMPRQMIRDTATSFFVSKIVWEDREVGDIDTAPDPSFIGQKLNDVFFFKARLGFLSGESVILSKTNDFFNFWPSTITEVLDDAPIDLNQPSNQVALLRDALPFLDDLLIFSDNIQFTFGSGSEVLKPTNAVMQNTTAYPASNIASAIRLGNNAYFVANQGNSSTFREYFVEPDTVINDAADITSHAPTYLPAEIKHITGDSNLRMIVMNSQLAANKSELYVYQYFWDGNAKVQSSWNKWTFGEFRTVIGAEFFLGSLYVLFINDNNDGSRDITLERIEINEQQTGNLPYLMHGDRQVIDNTLNAVLGAAGETQVELPFNDNHDRNALDDLVWVAVHATTGTVLIGERRNVAQDDLVFFPHNLVGTIGEYHLMRLYDMENTFSRYLLRDAKELGLTKGKLKLRRMEISSEDSGGYQIQITPNGRSQVRHIETGAEIGIANLMDPLSVVKSDDFGFLVMTDAKDVTIKLVSRSPHPLKIQAITYEFTYFSNSRGL